MKRFFALFSLTLFLAFTPIFPSEAQVDPTIQWKIWHLPQFDLVFDAKHQELAQLYAQRLSHVVQELQSEAPLLPERTVVVLNDRTDLTNGYATPIPQDLIVIFPVLPGAFESIGEYGDWGYEILLHEYMHVVSFSARRGVVKGLHSAFGSIMTPNILLPRWFLEGVAVEMETQKTSFGRLRSYFQDASIRALTSEPSFYATDFSTINETALPSWPQGARPYLFGSLMWSTIYSDKGSQGLKDLHWRYGGRFPFFIQAPARDVLGTDYISLFENVKRDVLDRTRRQLEILRSTGLSQTENLGFEKLETFSPSFSPDGHYLAFLGKDETLRRSVKILYRLNLQEPFTKDHLMTVFNEEHGDNSGELKPLPKNETKHDDDGPPSGSVQRISWFPDSVRFVYDKVDVINRFQESSDLYSYNLKTLKTERLTTGQRLREPAVSPSGKWIAAVKLEAGRTNLALVDVDTKQVHLVYASPWFGRISQPEFLSDDQILFAERANGKEVFKTVSLAVPSGVSPVERQNQSSVFAPLATFSKVNFPRLTGEGLLFQSSDKGLGQIYRLDMQTQKVQLMAQSSTSFFHSAQDPVHKDLYLTELTGKGYEIKRISQKTLSSQKISAAELKPLFADRYADNNKSFTGHDGPVTGEITDYSAWPYIRPHYWLPIFAWDTKSNWIGFSTSGSDPLAKHVYAAQAELELRKKTGSYLLGYLNNSTEAEIAATAYSLKLYVPGGNTSYQHQLETLDLLWQTPWSTDGQWGAGFTWNSKQFDSDFSNGFSSEYRLGPRLIFEYNTASSSGAQVSPESGQRIYFSPTFYLNRGDDDGYNLYEGLWQKYFSRSSFFPFSFMPTRHAFMTRIQGRWIDHRVNLSNMVITQNLNLFENPPTPIFLARGYQNGEFIGKSLLNMNLEYRFPLREIYLGYGTAPWFFKKLHGALVADGVQLEGYHVDSAGAFSRVESWKSFWSAGAELSLDMTLGYHFPITFYLGVYSAFDSIANDSGTVVLGVHM